MTPGHAQHVLDNEHDYSAATIYRAAALLDTSKEAYAAHEADPEAVDREERRILWVDICAGRFEAGAELCRQLAAEFDERDDLETTRGRWVVSLGHRFWLPAPRARQEIAIATRNEDGDIRTKPTKAEQARAGRCAPFVRPLAVRS